jgi:hypothetical protein
MTKPQSQPGTEPGTLLVPLTKGQFAIIDEADSWPLEWNWTATWNPTKRGFYAARSNCSTDRKRTILMHREVMGASPGTQVDHVNGDTLDNRRGNLRLATRGENQRNRGKTRNNKSGFKGVNWRKAEKKWHARIALNGKDHHLGYFSDRIEASLTYDAAAIKLHGNFARLNFPLISQAGMPLIAYQPKEVAK